MSAISIYLATKSTHVWGSWSRLREETRQDQTASKTRGFCMTKHHAIEIVSASILAGILSISAVRLEAAPSMAAPQSATPFSRFVQAGYHANPIPPVRKTTTMLVGRAVQITATKNTVPVGRPGLTGCTRLMGPIDDESPARSNGLPLHGGLCGVCRKNVFVLCANTGRRRGRSSTEPGLRLRSTDRCNSGCATFETRFSSLDFKMQRQRLQGEARS